MAVLMVPRHDPEAAPLPTLGPQVSAWLQGNLVHGPGDVRGRAYRIDKEKRGIVARLYELHPRLWTPPGTRTLQENPRGGRRAVKRAGISVRKGWAKTELAAALAGAELHPEAPVRFSHWAEEGEESTWLGWNWRTEQLEPYVYREGEPVGIGVSDPYIPMVAFTEEQSEELAFGALVVMLGEGPLAGDFDLGNGEAKSGVITVIGENGKAAGKAVAVAAAPNSRDGARTTFQLFDETHRQDTDRLRHAHQTMLQNLPKRREADAWSLEVTTSYEPGKDSIAERTHGYAKQIDAGRIEEPSLFYYHRYASDKHDLNTREGRAAAVLEASGPAAAYTDVDYVVGLSYDPDTDLQYWERVWLNREVSSSGQYFPVERWKELARDPLGNAFPKGFEPDPEVDALWMPKKGALVTLGFDGSRTGDSTGIVVTDVELRRQAVAGLWEHPRLNDGKPVEGWEVPMDAVDQALDHAFGYWDVVFFYPDPYWFETYVPIWTARYGTRKVGKRRMHRVAEWPTNRPRPMALSLRAYRAAIVRGEVTNNGDPRLRAHLANSVKFDTGLVDDEGKPLHTIRKERRDSPEKIDLAMAGDLSWEACRDALKLGAKKARKALHSPY